MFFKTAATISDYFIIWEACDKTIYDFLEKRQNILHHKQFNVGGVECRSS